MDISILLSQNTIIFFLNIFVYLLIFSKNRYKVKAQRFTFYLLRYIKNKVYVLLIQNKEPFLNENEKEPIIIKYEDKYNEKFSALSSEYLFSEDEKIQLKKEMEKLKKENEKDYEEKAINSILNDKMNKLENCFIMENTPSGNVILYYNNKCQHFEYYSDNTLPYRYLESVAKKYVITYKCKPLFIDMEEELKTYQEILKKEEERKEEEKKAEELKPKPEIKKNVFAKFKTYNKDAGSGRVNSVPPPKNSIPGKIQDESGKKVILKEKSNSYNYKGKLSNFPILKKVEKSVFNKKLKMSFADFKKMKK